MRTKKVNKFDYNVEQSIGGYYFISTEFNYPDGPETVWGGDSGCPDHYNEELVNEIYDNWDGELVSDDGEMWYINI